ncbi:hypothetical protein BOQ63_020770 [Streptomyces viridifaciens]|nr:hypothetical protein CP971_13885 [Streptomyces viridifaciens]UKZ06434.1 hypothetical protein BOQ63_020770 [Streptomyces viridifaciens]
MDGFEQRMDSAWEWWGAAIEDSQEGRWIRTDDERRIIDDIAAAAVGCPPSPDELPWRARLARIVRWAAVLRLAAGAGGWELAPVAGAAPPRPAGMAALLSAVYAVGEQGEIWLRGLPADGPPPVAEVLKAEAFLFGPGSVEDLRQFFYD